ncbi:MAG TPA: hypothetical protein DIC52_14035 [Candidatus Latescibacteria bacterium]|nr:hypothetical protein [Candidatus Latescibacterota bacterium]
MKATSAILACICLVLCLALIGFAPRGVNESTGPRGGVPAPEREFRAVWVATVDNIDWPSRPGLSADSQRVEARAILDRSSTLGLNAIILQVRPQCDAFYDSDLEPWSYYLTGEQGLAPDPFYDPLEFWIDEAHARGLELHAWFNPYRVKHPKQLGPMAESSIARQRPDLVRALGTGDFLWLDPGHPEVRELTLAVILDVATRYEIDGVHMDDYFYPYPSYNGGAEFPDEATWQAYQKLGGKLSRSDWRRNNVDRFVNDLHDRLRQLPRQVKFGISPFGIWRPNHPPSIEAGLNQHEVLFADARRWLHEGWVDYFAPQLYWPISQVPQSFPVLLGWWQQNNPHARHLWPGLFTSRVRRETGWRTQQVTDQIMITRGITPHSPGHIHFSARVLLDSTSVGRDGNLLGVDLAQGPYRRPALIPTTPWLDDTPPTAPQLSVQAGGGSALLAWRRPEGERPFLYVVYTERAGQGWRHQFLPATGTGLRVPMDSGDREDPQPLRAVAVTAVDRMGNESELHVRPLRQ